MNTETIIEGEAVEVTEGAELIPVQPVNLMRKDDPVDALRESERIAQEIAPRIREGNMVDVIDRREFVKIEGWRALGGMVGVVPREVEMVEVEDGWQCTVEAVYIPTGQIVGRATSSCTRDESRFRNRDGSWRTPPRFELQGMASTRAASRALRAPLGYVMSLGGFEATSAEEMSEVKDRQPRAEDNLQMGILPPDVAFGATVREAAWVKAKGIDKLVVVAGVANTNPERQDAGEKLWLEPGKPDYRQFVEHVCGGMEPPVGGETTALIGKPFDLTVTINGKWRNFTIAAPTPQETAA